jgi:putative endonuclease
MDAHLFKNCHPERSSGFAKRSSYGVEGPHARVHNSGHGKAFARWSPSAKGLGLGRGDGPQAVLGLYRREHVRHALRVTSKLSLPGDATKNGEIEGFSSKYKCKRLVYFESFDIVQRAIGREKQLKGWRRAKKIALIESVNARWEDLAEKWDSEMAFAGEAITVR